MARLPSRKTGVHREAVTNRDKIADERGEGARNMAADMSRFAPDRIRMDWESDVRRRSGKPKPAGRVTSTGGVRSEGKSR